MLFRNRLEKEKTEKGILDELRACRLLLERVVEVFCPEERGEKGKAEEEELSSEAEIKKNWFWEE